MRMLRDEVCVLEIDTNEKTTESGIILSTPQKKEGAIPGYIIAIGPDVNFVEVGQQAYLDWSKGTALNVDGKQAVSIQEKYITAVIEE